MVQEIQRCVAGIGNGSGGEIGAVVDGNGLLMALLDWPRVYYWTCIAPQRNWLLRIS